jgi:hypothetical protein
VLFGQGRETRTRVQASALSWRANAVGRNNSLSWGVHWYAANLVGTSTRWEGSWKIGCACPVLNRRSGLSVRNGVLLYKQLICAMMDFSCPIGRSAARSHVQKLQVNNPSVFALRLTDRDALVTGKRRLYQSTVCEFRLAVSWCGEPLSPATWKVLLSTEGSLIPPG